MKVIAHRGYSGKYPENTMLAFKKAEEAGCDEIEMDVQLTKDGEIVIIHDESIDRVTDGKGYVRDFTLEELQKFNVKGKFGDTFGFQPIPTLKEYLEWAKDKSITTNIEIKTGKYYYEDIEDKVVDLLKKFNVTDKVMFSSFNHLSLARCKELLPTVECGVLVLKQGIGNPGFYTKKHHFECYHPDIEGLTTDIVENCKRHNVKLNVWTIDTEELLDKLCELGCDGAITDFPDMCKQWLNGR